MTKMEHSICKRSRIIIAAISFVIFQAMFIKSDIEGKIAGLLLTGIMYLLSFVSTGSAKRIVKYGLKFKGGKRVLYYMVFPPVILFVMFLYLISGIMIINPIIEISDGIGGLIPEILFLGTALMFAIIITLPYVQALIILLIHRIEKEIIRQSVKDNKQKHKSAQSSYQQ